MKKIIMIVLCFVLLNKATAQADKVILDNVFQNINKATIPTGYLHDYAEAESFFKTLKTELCIFEYIETFYNINRNLHI